MYPFRVYPFLPKNHTKVHIPLLWRSNRNYKRSIRLARFWKFFQRTQHRI